MLGSGNDVFKVIVNGINDENMRPEDQIGHR